MEKKWNEEKTLTSLAPFFHWAIRFLSHAHLPASVVLVRDGRDTLPLYFPNK